MSETIKPGMSRSKKRILIVLIACAVVVIGYAVASVLLWRNYQADAVGAVTEVKENISTALEAESEVSREKLREVTALSNNLGDVCNSHALITWQAAVIPAVKDLVARCNTASNQVRELTGVLTKVEGYLADEATATAMLREVSGATKIDDVTVASWQDIAHRLDELEVRDEFEPVRAKLAEQASAIEDAWEKLEAANQKKDKKAFDESRASLKKAYDSLRTTIEAEQEPWLRILSDLERAYRSL